MSVTITHRKRDLAVAWCHENVGKLKHSSPIVSYFGEGWSMTHNKPVGKIPTMSVVIHNKELELLFALRFADGNN